MREKNTNKQNTKTPMPEQESKVAFYDTNRPLHKVLPFVFWGFAVLLGFMLYFPNSGVLGNWANRSLTGCFSFFAYAIPPLVFLHGCLWKWEIKKKRAISHGVYALLFLVMANVLWYTFLPGNVGGTQAFFESGMTGTTPGAIGAFIGYGLEFLTGIMGAPILAILILVMFVYYFLGLAYRTPKVKVKPEPKTEGGHQMTIDEVKPVPKKERKPRMTLKQKFALWRENRKKTPKAKQAKTQKKSTPIPPKEEGYYPETDETFEEIRRRMEAEEKRYQKQQKKAGKSVVTAPKAQPVSPKKPVREPVNPSPRMEADIPLDLQKDQPQAEVGVTPMDALSADAAFAGFDPLSDTAYINTGSPVWRKVNSSLIFDDRKKAPERAAVDTDRSKIHATREGVVSESGGVGSFRIDAKHMDIPSSRSLRPKNKNPLPKVEETAPEPAYTTDISDILSDIESGNLRDNSPLSREAAAPTLSYEDLDAPKASPMPSASPLEEEPVQETISEELLPKKEPIPQKRTPKTDADKQNYVIHHYEPPTQNRGGEQEEIMVATSHVVDHNHEVKGDTPTKKIKAGPDYSKYVYPSLSLLERSTAPVRGDSETEISDMINRLVREFRKFRIEIMVHDVTIGPRVTRYSISPPDGTRISAIMNLSNDIALGLAVKSIRIEPVPGTPYLGVEIPNHTPTSVPLSSLIDHESFRKSKNVTTIPLGASVTGQPVLADIGKMPHVLVAGATGMGKSVFLNSLLISLLYRARPDEVKLILVDPKRVELSIYNGIPHLLIPPVVDAQKAAGALIWAVGEMERRYHLMETVGMRSIEGYNEVVSKDPSKGEVQPKIIIAIDELNDLMMQARDAVEPAVMSIAQKARAAGIHLILCTQRPSVDVITGVIKANIPSRIALHVSSGTDSRTILDAYGAEKLLDKGDMLVAIAGAEPIRVQSAYVSDKEVENVTSFLKQNAGPNVYDEIINSQIESETEKYKNSGKRAEKSRDDGDTPDGSIFEDSKFVEACYVAFENGKISTSLLQRSCSLGYGRAAKYIDIMQSMGIVSAPDGPKPRDVLMTRDQFMEMVSRETYSGE